MVTVATTKSLLT